MKELLYIFIGGGVGSCLRFSISALWQHMRLNPTYSDILFPWPTFVANILGCFLIGLFYQFAATDAHPTLSHSTLLLLTTGLCGGFTTFSTFSFESVHLLHSGHYSTFALYSLGSVILGMTAAFLPSLLKLFS